MPEQPRQLCRWVPRILLSSLLCTLGLGFSTPAQAQRELPDFSDYATLTFAQEYSLLVINRERAAAGAGAVRLDPLANQVAKQHAQDMLARGYFSHWDPEGLKPTRRFNLLGGYHALGENIYFAHGYSGTVEELVDVLMRVLMDSPGHRRTIIDPAYTHVGLGFAMDRAGGDFYVSQEFITRVGGDYHCPLFARVGERVEFSGRFDSQRYEVEQVTVSYEERPQPRDRRWLAKTNEYSDGEKMIAGYVPNPHTTFNGMDTFHDLQIDQQQGWFKCQALMDFKGREGMYYILLWLRDRASGRSFIAATATVDVTR